MSAIEKENEQLKEEVLRLDLELRVMRVERDEAHRAVRALCASPVIVGMAARIREDAIDRNDKIVFDLAQHMLNQGVSLARDEAGPGEQAGRA